MRQLLNYRFGNGEKTSKQQLNDVFVLSYLLLPKNTML